MIAQFWRPRKYLEASRMPPVKLTEGDFFRYNAPFRQWLFDAKGKQIGEYSTEEAKSVFKKEFIVVWNEDKLPRKKFRF